MALGGTSQGLHSPSVALSVRWAFSQRQGSLTDRAPKEAVLPTLGAQQGARDGCGPAAGSGTPALTRWPRKLAGRPGHTELWTPWQGRRRRAEECGFEECLTQGRNSTLLFFFFFHSKLGFSARKWAQSAILSFFSLWLPDCSSLRGQKVASFFFFFLNWEAAVGTRKDPGFGGRQSWLGLHPRFSISIEKDPDAGKD